MRDTPVVPLLLALGAARDLETRRHRARVVLRWREGAAGSRCIETVTAACSVIVLDYFNMYR